MHCELQLLDRELVCDDGMSLLRMPFNLGLSYPFGIVMGSFLMAPPLSYVGNRLLGHGSPLVEPLFLAVVLLLFIHPRSYEHPLVAIVGALFLAGVAAHALAGDLVSAAMLPLLWVILTLPIIAGGLILGLPLLLLTLIALVSFRRSIERSLLIWCFFAPVAVTAAWIGLEGLFGRAGHGGAWSRIALVLVSAAIAANKFYTLSRGPEGR
jgi:hypothetical protein